MSLKSLSKTNDPKNQTDIKYTYKKENKNVWKINLKKHFFWLSGVLDTAKLSLAAFWTPLSPNFVVDYLSEYESVCEKNLHFLSGPIDSLIREKNENKFLVTLSL